MKKNIFAFLRTMMLVALVPVLSISLVACEPESGAGGNGSEDGGAEDTTSEIAVTGLVDAFGCTYADISGYANLNLLPAGSGNPVIGVEVVKADAENNDGAIQSTAGSLIGNIFTVSFDNLSPATEYKYRSFVTYGGITYYGNKYKNFTTKEVVGITSTGEASEITRTSAVLSASVQTEGADVREDFYIGIAWAASKAAICVDGSFECSKISVQDVENGTCSVLLNNLSGGTTYYYASFTLVGDVYIFSSVEEFTTKVLVHKAGEAIDLGLSVKWASYNVGAESPEEYGVYYAWGEIEEKTDYSWFTYKWCNGSYDTQTKYCTSSSYGTVDNKAILDPEDDVAHVKWGGSWRMPTKAEQDELRSKCSWSRTSVNGVNGCRVTGPNGNSIFLPAAGYRDGENVYYHGSYGYYWSATLRLYYNYEAYELFVDYGGDVILDDGSRHGRDYGYSVRPVTE